MAEGSIESKQMESEGYIRNEKERQRKRERERDPQSKRPHMRKRHRKVIEKIAIEDISFDNTK